MLIVEDERAVARTLGRALERRGYSVVFAHTCAEALVASAYAGCGVLDIDLPDGSGIELGRSLLEQGRVGGLVFFSGTLEARSRMLASELGACFVPKAAGFGELLQTIDDVMELTQEPKRASQH